MNNKKKMVLGAAFVVAIMALAGVGYAAITENFKAETSSGAQTIDVDWAKISLTDPNLYTARTVPVTEKAFYWNSSTNASGTTWVPAAENVQMVYALELNLTAVEPTDKLNLEITGLKLANDSGFTLTATFNDDPLSPDADGKAVVGDDNTTKSYFANGTLEVILTPAAVTTDATPPLTAVFPALGFKLIGQNVAAA